MKTRGRPYRLMPALIVAITALALGASVLAVPPESERFRRDAPRIAREETALPTGGFREIDNTPPQVVGDFVDTGGDTCAEAIVVPVPVGTVRIPLTVTIRGDSTAATGPDCDSMLGTVWWEAFQIDECATVTIDFCGTNMIRPDGSNILAGLCSPDGASCGQFFAVTRSSHEVCPEGQLWMVFEELPAGTYYFPILSDSASLDLPQRYVIHIGAGKCAGACGGCLGACCETSDRTCTDNIDRQDCVDQAQEWFVRAHCSDLECRPSDVEFDASRVTLSSRIPVDEFPSGSTSANDVWGYVSPAGREYAIIGLNDGTGFVDVTDPQNPVIVADIPDAHSLWSDVAVYQQYAYNVNENDGGMQIIDLTRIDDGIVALVGALTQDGFRRAHNVFVNSESGYAYLCGANSPTSGLVAVDVHVPDNPVMVGIWEEAYAHDVYVVSYDDCPYSGRTGPCEIAFAFAGGTGLKIVDVTVKTEMTTISTLDYPNLAYCHQGWLSDDRRHLFMGDEADESRFNLTTTTHLVNVEDLGNPQYIGSFTNGRSSIDHNLMVRGHFVFEANYTSGLRIYDVSDINTIQEIAYFDTHPEGNTRTFAGAWGVFAGFPSGLVVVSDMQRGLFVLDPCLPAFALPGDFNGDGDADLGDFSRLQHCFGPGPLGTGCEVVDVDCDGNVDLNDFSAFLSSVAGTTTP